jgi:hypothetical protein
MTVRTLVQRSLRMLGVVGPVDAASSEDASIALETLQTLLKQYIAQGVFGPLTDVAVTAAYEAGENERVANLSGGVVTITAPATIEDEDTGEDRAPYDRSVIVIVGGDQMIYDDAQGDWIEVDELTLDSAEPLATFNLAAPLAVELAPQFGFDPMASVIANAVRTRAALRIKKPISVTAPLATIRLHANWRGR